VFAPVRQDYLHLVEHQDGPAATSS
jgi:hypothetical protein